MRRAQIKTALIDINVMAALPSMDEMRRGLYKCQLTNVKGLEKLTQLTNLNLNDNQLTDVKGLEKLTKLKVLSLHSNPNLTMLYLWGREAIFIWRHENKVYLPPRPNAPA